jgi:hypothetical protein
MLVAEAAHLPAAQAAYLAHYGLGSGDDPASQRGQPSAALLLRPAPRVQCPTCLRELIPHQLEEVRHGGIFEASGSYDSGIFGESNARAQYTYLCTFCGSEVHPPWGR